MSTEGIENNDQLKDVELYVFLGWKSIKGKTANDVLEIMKRCSFIKPSSVMKSQKVAGFCLPKFKNRQDADTFFHYYNKQKCTLCRSLTSLFVKPAKFKEQPAAQYNCDTIQATLNHVSTWCCCTSITKSSNGNHISDKKTETTTHMPSTSTMASLRPSHTINTPTETHHDTNASKTINTTATVIEQDPVLGVYEQEIHKIKEEIKEDELKLMKKKREIEHDELNIQKKSISLLLQLKSLK